jgi:hypothetical protein
MTMTRKMKNRPSRWIRDEKGQVLILVMIFMLLGMLIITPLLQYMGTGINTGRIFQDKTDELYCADAGIEDGTWQIKYDQLIDTFPTYNAYEYNYNNTTTPWHYTLPGQVNSKSATVYISNVWMPKDIPQPTKEQAANVIAAGKLILTDSVYGTSTGKINITYNGSDDTWTVTTLGVWLPPGFTYVPGSSNLEGIYSSEDMYTYDSGQAVVWTFNPAYAFSIFPDVDASNIPMICSITYDFVAQQSGTTPGAISWIDTNLDITGGVGSPYYVTWDADVKVYHITSISGDTTAESYLAKHDLRQLGAAINGDYKAIGSSLMSMGSGHTQSNDPKGIQYEAVNYPNYASASEADIPSDASIKAAYLYWSGWLSDSDEQLGTLYNGKYYGTRVSFLINGNQVGPVTSSKNQTRLANGTSNGDYTYSCYADVTALVIAELKQEHPGASNYPGNATYSVGPAQNYILGDTGNEKSYAGWSLILIYTSASTQGHQIYLFDNFMYATWTGQSGYGANSQHGSDIDPTGNTQGPGGVISGFLVPQQIPGETNAATLTAFVGEGDWCYAGDFLAFNAPSQYWSDPWSIPDGNPSKLWDGITQGTNYLAGTPYLPNTNTKPDNVWNGFSQQTNLFSGVDIKTFNISWASGLLHAGDTAARIDMPTWSDSWDLVYLILSFRSATTTGGDISFLIQQ